MQPFFSIIIPVYNVAPYLRECLDSVQAQTFTDWECLCVDDGSTDDSSAILDEYAQKDTRFRVFHKKNGGVSSARNLALDNIKGDWVCFLDGDDVLALGMFRFLKYQIKSNAQLDVISFCSQTFNDGTQCVFNDYSKNHVHEVLDLSSTYPNRMEVEYFFGGKCYHKRIMEDVRFLNYKNGEDVLFLFSAIIRAQRLLISNAVLYGYRQRYGSASHMRITKQRVLDHINTTLEIVRVLRVSSRQVAWGVQRRKMLALTEGVMQLLHLTQSKKDADIWTVWMNALREMCENGEIRGIRLLMTKLLLYTRSYFIAYCCFYIPVWLKIHGVHR